MSQVKTCDNCGRRIDENNPSVAKLYIAPFTSGKTRALHSLYTGHMDIGACCRQPIISDMKWVKRKKRVKSV